MASSHDECAALQAELESLNADIADLVATLERLESGGRNTADDHLIRTIRSLIRERSQEARSVQANLFVCRQTQRAGASLVDFKLTQSGMVTRPMPALPLVAGKSTLLRPTAYIPNPQATIAAAWLDVVRQDTGALVGTVRGYAIGNDDRSLFDGIRPDDHVHFFVPRRFLAAEGRYRFDWRSEVDGVQRRGVAFSGVTCIENAGIPMVGYSFDEGLFANSPLGALFIFSHHLVHAARILPIKDTVGPLARAGSGFGGADGIRFTFVDGVPLREQGSLGIYEREFVLSDMMVGNAFWADRFLTFNFTVGRTSTAMASPTLTRAPSSSRPRAGAMRQLPSASKTLGMRSRALAAFNEVSLGAFPDRKRRSSRWHSSPAGTDCKIERA